MKRTTVLALTIALSFLFVSHAHALTITPVRQEIQGDPGTTVKQEMSLINELDTSVTYYSSFANFEAQGDTGSPAFVAATDDIGTWMKTSESVVLGPRETKTVAIAIDIPTDATPGGHFGALFWGTAPDSTTPGQVAISAKTGMLILLSVKGDVKEAGGLTTFNTTDNKFWYNTLPVSFEYRFKNDGGDRVKPTGKITIRDTVYLPADRIDANPVQGNVLPASTRKFKVDWIKYEEPGGEKLAMSSMGKFFHTVRYQWKNFALGYYTAHIDIAYGSQDQHAKDVAKFFVLPWQLVICIILVLSIVWWGGKKILKKYNQFVIRQARAGMRADVSTDE